MAKGSNIPERQLSTRALGFLKALVELHIRDGAPVGSRTLAKSAGMDLSPATVRNVMADLEELGLVASPHTSAGRVPTAAGFRLFVDSLLTTRPVSAGEIQLLQSQLDTGDKVVNASELMARASQMLSGLTHLAGMVTVPRRNHKMFRQIELVSLSATRVLAILVTQDGEVHNRVLLMGQPITAAELERASNYLTSLFQGRDLQQVRARILAELEAAHAKMNTVMRQVLSVADGMLESAESRKDFYVTGQTNLMEFGELANLQRLKDLFDAFTQKSQLLDVLDRCMAAKGVQIFIGEESGYSFFKDCSLVTAGYSVDDKAIGVLGVIGPARMDYQRIIPLVDITAQMLSAALRQ